MFHPQVSNFAATGHHGTGDIEGFVELVAQSEAGLALIQTDDFNPPETLRCLQRADGFQMVLGALPERPATVAPFLLKRADIPDMLRLVHLTQPGPFHTRTTEFGAYFGFRYEGRLIAMAGERLKPPGFTEISAVCVHPEFRGKGLARALVTHLAHNILSRGETPFLHLYSDNHAALTLYESLGFYVRAPVHVISVHSARSVQCYDGKRDFFPTSAVSGVKND